MTTLEELRAHGVLDGLDLRFAQMLGQLTGADDRVLLAAALANRAPRVGDVGVDLTRIAEALDDLVDGELALPEPSAWIASLAGNERLVRSADAPGPSPLVREGSMLYLDRYFRYQQRLANALLERAASLRDDVDEGALASGLAALFDDDPRTALQRAAAESAVRRCLTIVAGGPGTGKTAVVVKVLALLNQQAVARGAPIPRVVMVAPTGKAAARLSESIRRTKDTWIPEALRGDIPEDASTIHRGLGVSWGSPRFRRDASSPMTADVVVVDEASMVDLPLMAKLVDAVPERARLILLGDPDQLVSVELGAVLGDLCAAPALHGARVQLEHTWRYPVKSGIANLARAINEGDAATALAVLADPKATDVERVHALDDDAFETLLRQRVVERYREVVEADEPTAALRALDRFRLLCAHRRGRRGVERLNLAIERWLAEEGHLELDREWYAGRPVMVIRNDKQLELYNGDVGVILADGDKRRAWFPAPGGGVRSFSPSLIPEHVTVFATTVHKAQGSEYEEVLVVLPEEASRVLTRELLYTAVTRATKRVVVVGSEEVVAQGVGRRVERMSGLRGALG